MDDDLFCFNCGSRLKIETKAPNIDLGDLNSLNGNSAPGEEPKVVTMNKHVFTWVFAFLLGGLGVDRFIRGQILFGIIKVLTAGGFGVWALVDFIIAIVKAYGSSYGNVEEFTFINGNYSETTTIAV